MSLSSIVLFFEKYSIAPLTKLYNISIISGLPRQVNTEHLISTQRETERHRLAQEAEFHSADRPANNGVHPVTTGGIGAEAYHNRRYPRIRGESIHLNEGEFFGIEQHDITPIREHIYVPQERITDQREFIENRQRLRELEDKYDDLQVELAMKNECIDNISKEREDMRDILNKQDHLIAQYMSANATMARQANESRNALHKIRAELTVSERERHRLSQELFTLRQSMQSALVGDTSNQGVQDNMVSTCRSMSHIESGSSRLMARGMVGSSTSTISNSSPTSSIAPSSTTRYATSSCVSSVSSLNDDCDKFFKSIYNQCNIDRVKAALSNFSTLVSQEKDSCVTECLSHSLRRQIQLIRCRDLNTVEDVNKCWVPNEDYVICKEIESTPQSTLLLIRRKERFFLLKVKYKK